MFEGRGVQQEEERQGIRPNCNKSTSGEFSEEKFLPIEVNFYLSK